MSAPSSPTAGSPRGATTRPCVCGAPRRACARPCWRGTRGRCMPVPRSPTGGSRLGAGTRPCVCGRSPDARRPAWRRRDVPVSRARPRPGRTRRTARGRPSTFDPRRRLQHAAARGWPAGRRRSLPGQVGARLEDSRPSRLARAAAGRSKTDGRFIGLRKPLRAQNQFATAVAHHCGWRIICE